MHACNCHNYYDFFVLIALAELRLCCLQVRVGGYRLPKDLGIGQFRELKPHEVRRVTDKAAQADPYLR